VRKIQAAPAPATFIAAPFTCSNGRGIRGIVVVSRTRSSGYHGMAGHDLQGGTIKTGLSATVM